MTLNEHDRQLLADLTTHPGWKILNQCLDDSLDKRARGLARTLLVEEADVDLTQLERERAYWKAMRDLLKHPERAASYFEKE